MAYATDDTTCARVKIEISQELTLERQAFDAHMRINNGLTNITLENVGVNVDFADEAGNAVSATSDPNAAGALFFIRLDTMSNIADVGGSGTVAPSTSADIHWLIIPAPGAANGLQSGKLYYVGATLSYTIGGEPHVTKVTPDYIYVKPMPELTLDYFLPNDVYGDDPLTSEIESVVPFTLGVRVRNTGAGTAKNVKIDSAQPKIVENEQGLLINFQLEGSEVNGQPATPSLLADFGDIAPDTAGTGRWIMTCTLAGRFVDFTATFTHADELGGALTSLIDAVNTHFLVQDVLVDLAGRDGIRDFLARDGGVYRVYESDNLDTDVADQSASASLAPGGQSGGETRYTLSAPVTAGLMFVKLADPFGGQKMLKNVLRSDGKQIAAANAWLSQTRAKGQPVQYFVNLFDANTTDSYTFFFEEASAGPQPPNLQFIPDRTRGEGQQLSFIVEASDPNGTTPVLSADPLPVGAHFTDQGTGVGIFDWTPADGQSGSYQVTFRASDGALEDSQIATITIVTVGSPPTIAPIGPKSVAESESLFFVVAASDPDGTVPIVTAQALPQGASFDGALFTWQPGFDQAGSYAVTFTASDGKYSAARTVVIAVTDVNRPPAVPVIAEPLPGGEVALLTPALTVAGGVDPDGDALAYAFEVYADAGLTMTVASNPAVPGGAVDTSWSLPAPLAENTRYHWRVRAGDAASFSEWAEGSFFVNSANDPPGSFVTSAPADGTTVSTLTPRLSVTNSTDVDGDPLTYSFEVYRDASLTDLAAAGTGVAQGGEGSTSWTVSVALGDNTTYYWRALATDQHGATTASGAAIFFVDTSKRGPSTPAIAAPPVAGEVGASSLTLSVLNATDPDGDSLTYLFQMDVVNTFDGPSRWVSGVTAETPGTTGVQVSALQENTWYFWRAKAGDGSVESGWVQGSFFVNAANEPPSVPTLRNPGQGAWVATGSPELQVTAAVDADHDALDYEFQVYQDSELTSLTAAGSADTPNWAVSPLLADGTWYFWVARAKDEHGLAGWWTTAASFFVKDNGVDDPPTIAITQPAAAQTVTIEPVLIAWDDRDPDSNATIALYYDTDNTGADGTLIADGIPEDPDQEGDGFSWDLAGLPPGTYWVYAVIADAHATAVAYSGFPVTKDNLAPTDILLSPAAVAENAAAGTEVGTFDTVDPDAGDPFTYTLVSGEGDADNLAFQITGGTLYAAVSFDFETRNTYSIRVQSTDRGELSTEKVFTIAIQDILEPLCGSAAGGTAAAAPSANLCDPGTASGVTTNGSTFTWTCATGPGVPVKDCTATWAFTVTPSAGDGGALSPDTAQTVVNDTTQQFFVTAAAGYSILAVSGCGGTPFDNDDAAVTSHEYHTGPVVGACTVSASFADRTPPSSSVFEPMSGASLMATTYRILGSASDTGSGLGMVEISVDGEEWHAASGNGSWSYDWTVPSDGSFTIRSRATDNAGNVEIPGAGVTLTAYRRQPSAVTVSGSELRLGGNPFTIQGVVYSPVPIGIDPETTEPYGDYYTAAFAGIHDRDLALLRTMGANAVLIPYWSDTADHRVFLDKAFNAGSNPVYVIAGFWINSGLDLDPVSQSNVREQLKAQFREMVETHRNHPAILLWTIGTDLNAPGMYGGDLGNLFSLIEELAGEAHTVEGGAAHPVAASLADVDLIGTIAAFDGTVPSLDIWAAAVHRGDTFGTLFTEYKSSSGKPLVLLGYGIDAYDTAQGDEYENLGSPLQGDHAVALWDEIAANADSCAGGTITEYSDGWWRGKQSSGDGCPDADPSVQTACGQSVASEPDGRLNEEWRGIVRMVDNGADPDLAQPREAYYALQYLWAPAGLSPAILDDPPSIPSFGSVNVGQVSAEQTVTLTNTGSANLGIGAIAVLGSNPTDFGARHDECSGRTLVPAGSCTLGVVFTPTAKLARNAVLSVPSNDPARGTLSMVLQGNGIDTLPPSGTLVINAGAEWTKSALVTLSLTAVDASPTIQMCISNTRSCTAWTAFAAKKSWKLTAGNGTKTVYAKFRDPSGNATPAATPYTDTIGLDVALPVNGTLTATPGAGQIALTWDKFSDALSGIASYKVVFAFGSAPASCAKGTVVPDYDGTTTDYTHTGLINKTYGYRVCAIDKAGTISTGATAKAKPLTTEATPTPPEGSIIVNNDAAWTRSPVVTLSLTAADASPPVQMCISNAPSCTAWTAFSATKPWTLASGSGTKTVYARFRDTWGNATAAATPYTDTIGLDAVAPVNGTLTATPGAGQIALTWASFSDALSGIASYKVVFAVGTAPASCAKGSVVPDYDGTTENYTHTGLINTTYGYRVCAIDKAGNISTGAIRSGKPTP